MDKRLRLLRKNLDLTQQEFADRLGIKRNTIANYETGRNEPIDAVLSLICREFNVNEEWLRYGMGEMFKEESTFSLDDYAAANHLTDIEKNIICGLMALDKNVREALLDVFKKAFGIYENSAYYNAPKTPQELERLFPPVDDNDSDSSAG